MKKEEKKEKKQEMKQNSEELRAEIDSCRAQNADLMDTLKRLAADFDNYRKRSEQEKKEAASFAGNQLVFKLFPILDNFKRSGEHAPEIKEDGEENKKMSAYLEGIKQIERQLENLLEEAGLKKVVTVGQNFDHNMMEAVSYEPHPGIPEGLVIEEYESGYVLGEKVVRPAKVRVSSGK
jgi:molecular chaperone GrpE